MRTVKLTIFQQIAVLLNENFNIMTYGYAR